MMPAVPPNSSITTATLLRCLMKFSSTDCSGMVSGTKLTSIMTLSMLLGAVKRLLELT